MTSNFNLSALLAAAPAAAADFKANEPLASPPDMTMAEIVAGLMTARDDLAKVSAFLAARPGAVRALDRILAAQEAQGVAWAATARKFLAALPGGLAAAVKYAPDLATAITLVAPVPTWHPGPRVER